MARSNGPLGPAGTRPRPPASSDDPFAPPRDSQTATGRQRHPGHGRAARQGQGYHFPPEPGSELRLPAATARPSTAIRPDSSRSICAPTVGPARSARLRSGQLHAQRCPAALSAGGSAAVRAGLPIKILTHSRAMANAEPNTTTSLPKKRRRRAAAAAGCSSWRRWSVPSASAARLPTRTSPSSRPTADACRWSRPIPTSRSGRTAAAPLANDKRMQGRLGEDAGQQNTAAAAPETQDERSERVRAGRAAYARYRLRQEVAGLAARSHRRAGRGAPPIVPGIMLENHGAASPAGHRSRRLLPRQPPQRVTIGQPPPPAYSRRRRHPPAR